MSRPQEFTIHIEPDGRIVLDGRQMEDASYRRILELLQDTVGPARPLEVEGDPPERYLTGQTEAGRQTGRRTAREKDRQEQSDRQIGRKT
jgi:hypothetical protein